LFKLLLLLFCIFLSSISPLDACAEQGQAAQGTSTSPITLAVGDLTVTFADNTAFGEFHKSRYNGIASLVHSASPGNLFVPDYAGFNLEHFFGGERLEELFEPREHSMILSQIDSRTVQLHQPPSPRSKVETNQIFKVVPPHSIDIQVRAVLGDLTHFPHGYAGLFWASYIHRPENRAVFFWGRSQEDPTPRWIEAFSEVHGVKSSHLYAEDRFQPFYSADFNVTLANHFSDFQYLEPCYFGRSGKMVFAVFFDRSEGIRFSQSPTGGGGKNPAWDHHFLIRNPEVGKEYGYRARVVYKPFISNEDIRAEFSEWRRQLN